MTDKARPNWAPGMPESGPSQQPLALEDMRTLPERFPEQAFIIGGGGRPGFSSFIVEVEYMMYTPDTPKNAELELIMSTFPLGSPLLWSVVIVPLKDLESIRDVGKKYGFELKPGIPVAIDENGEHWFHMNSGPNVFCVSGQLEDEELLAKYDAHWRDVIDKHQQGIPWKS